jgi:hypothetical protein
MKTYGTQLIAEERTRQIENEKWTEEHDSQHNRGEMAIAAACYAVEGTDAEVEHPDYPGGWPWESKWDKREKHSYMRRLVIAGALIAAEIDRHIKQRSDDIIEAEILCDGRPVIEPPVNIE